jgi:hypothetical protein
MRSPSQEISEECIRVVSKCKFMPEKLHNKAHQMPYVIPINFDWENPKHHFQPLTH